MVLSGLITSAVVGFSTAALAQSAGAEPVTTDIGTFNPNLAAPLFKKVAAFIETHVVPVIVRHALAGRCLAKTEDALFGDGTAVDMVLDTLAERGYHAVYEEHRLPVPRSVDRETGLIRCEDRTVHTFEIRFHPPEIRRGH